MFCWLHSQYCWFKKNTPEQVAATNLESWAKSDFETYLHTYPTFRLRNRALSFAGDSNADIKKVAEAMSEYFDGAETRDIEILNTRIIEQHEITDNSIYVKLQDKYDDITTEELKAITEIATIMVGYMFEGEVRETEIECILDPGDIFPAGYRDRREDTEQTDDDKQN